MAQYDELAAKLRDRLAELTKRVDAIEKELREPLDADSGEKATQLEDEDALEGIDDVLLAEARQTEATLARIENGTYGMCLNCGDNIDEKRLAAMPTAAKCLSCASS